MRSTCEIEDFDLLKLNIEFLTEGTLNDEGEGEVGLEFGYRVERHKIEPNRYKFFLRVNATELGSDEKPLGISLQSEIVGFLLLPAELSEEDQYKNIRLQGVNLLYGVLRGLVSSATGSFPNGKFVLPTIMPNDVVETIESKKTANQSKSDKSTKRTAKKAIKSLKEPEK